MRILITGVTGFAGGHLAEALLARGTDEVFGSARRRQWPETWRHLAGRVLLRSCDLCDRAAVEQLVRDVQPEQVYHLAGYAHVGRSFQEPDAAWASNLTATRNLFEAVERVARLPQPWHPRILFVSSGQVYGDPEPPEVTCDEHSLLRPASPYAASKAAADLVAYQVTRSPGLHVVRARPFNHFGPRQSPEYAVANFARQVAAIEQGRQPPRVETGNLSALRDLTDVRDTVRAYQLLMEQGRKGEAYNVGTGVAHSMQDILTRLLALAQVRAEVRQRTDPQRAAESPALRADAAKLRRETGWAPQFSLDQTLADTLEYWRRNSEW